MATLYSDPFASMKNKNTPRDRVGANGGMYTAPTFYESQDKKTGIAGTDYNPTPNPPGGYTTPAGTDYVPTPAYPRIGGRGTGTGGSLPGTRYEPTPNPPTGYGTLPGTDYVPTPAMPRFSGRYGTLPGVEYNPTPIQGGGLVGLARLIADINRKV